MARLSGAERRRQIIEAATEAVLRRGLAQAATRDVTKALGVGSGLLHHYFASWAELRAEAVRLAARREIDEVQAMVAGLPALEALDRLADWMVEDDDMRHWRLWLNAQDEAHRDDLLAQVMNAAMAEWHQVIADLLVRTVKRRGAQRIDTEAAAWRLAALMDGLAGAMLIRGSLVTPAKARDLMKTQLMLELGRAA